jgi:hypothetical protein
VLTLCAHYAPDIIRFHPDPAKRAGVAARLGRHGGSAAFGHDIRLGAVRPDEAELHPVVH